MPAVAAAPQERKCLQWHKTAESPHKYLPKLRRGAGCCNDSSTGHKFAQGSSQNRLAEKIVREQSAKVEKWSYGPYEIDSVRNVHDRVDHLNQYRCQKISSQIEE